MNRLEDILRGKVPEESLGYCIQLWDQAPFQFKLSKSRSSKLGDYRYDPRNGSHTVTVNADLNPYQFLITYIHEVAHRRVHQPRSGMKPHGPVWKQTFQHLMLPVLRPEIFPEDILRVLARHMKNPKASTAADPKLLNVLSAYNTQKQLGPTLKELQLNEEFVFRKRAFRKLQEKRTRAVCLDLKNQKRYLIPMVVEVEALY